MEESWAEGVPIRVEGWVVATPPSESEPAGWGVTGATTTGEGWRSMDGFDNVEADPRGRMAAEETTAVEGAVWVGNDSAGADTIEGRGWLVPVMA